MQPFVSYNYGKADSARLKQGIKYVTIIAFIYAVCIWSVSMAFPVVYARLFSASEAVTQIVMRYTPMFLMGSIMFFVQMTLQNVNVGLGQAKEALLLAVNRKVVILIPLCFVLTHFLGFKGVYLSEGIADLVAGIITAIVIFTSFPKIFRRREEEVKQAASNCSVIYGAFSDYFRRTVFAAQTGRLSSSQNILMRTAPLSTAALIFSAAG